MQSSGRCPKCGNDNPYDRLQCATCNARLPWADAFEAVRRSALAEGQRAAFDAGLRQAFETARREAVEAARLDVPPATGASRFDLTDGASTLDAPPARDGGDHACTAARTPLPAPPAQHQSASEAPASSLAPLAVSGVTVVAGMAVWVCGLVVLCLTLNEAGLKPALTIVAVILLSASWVYYDATNLLVQQGDLVGGFDHSPAGWAVGCVVMWPLAFPAYLAARPLYQDIADEPDFRSAALTAAREARRQPRSVLRLAVVAELTTLFLLCLPSAVTGVQFAWSPEGWQFPAGFRWPQELNPLAALHAVARPAPTIDAPSRSKPPSLAGAMAPDHGSGRLRLVDKFHGSTTRDTASFTIHSAQWQIAWKTQPGAAGPMSFQVEVRGADGSLRYMAANLIGASSDSTVIHDSGIFYLHIATSQPYTVSVAEYP